MQSVRFFNAHKMAKKAEVPEPDSPHQWTPNNLRRSVSRLPGLPRPQSPFVRSSTDTGVPADEILIFICLCAKYYGTKISENPNGGSIINISSDLGLIGPDQRLYRKEGLEDKQQPVKPVTYPVVKAGLIGLTRYLATYWAEQNVRCNAICPGGVETQQPPEFLKEVSSRVPMNRLAQIDEYQGVLVWMLSGAASYLNGAIIPIDGGRTAW